MYRPGVPLQIFVVKTAWLPNCILVICGNWVYLIIPEQTFVSMINTYLMFGVINVMFLTFEFNNDVTIAKATLGASCDAPICLGEIIVFRCCLGGPCFNFPCPMTTRL